MKNLLIVLVVVLGSGAAAYLYYNPIKPNKTAEVESTGSIPVVSTAPEKNQAEAQADEAEARADDEVTAEAPADETDSAKDKLSVIAKLSAALGGVSESSIKPAPMPGWYEVARGSAIGYVSEDGKFLIDGDLIDLQSKVNLTDKRRSQWRKDSVALIDESKMIIFEPEKVKHTVTVFTDVDCGYCRKLHAEMKDYMDEGIRIRYVFYPLRGEQAKSFKTAENVWCSEDRHEALTLAKQGKEIKAEACENPVAMHLQTGMKIGIRGTPGLVTEDGKLLPGYMPAKTLLAELEKG